ncbi:MAG: hypothetical protein GKS07_08435 [Nitrosopumilus sp.]|nr:MAG: hypothetical protein GKS07_08435 [Nitrosopumilus sp.]
MPKSEAEAMSRGYYGMRCTDMKCKSWQIFYEPALQTYEVQREDNSGELLFKENGKPDMETKKRIVKRCHCYTCGRIMNPITQKLTKEIPGITIGYHKNV